MCFLKNKRIYNIKMRISKIQMKSKILRIKWYKITALNLKGELNKKLKCDF